jgi:hypothetical protein
MAVASQRLKSDESDELEMEKDASRPFFKRQEGRLSLSLSLSLSRSLSLSLMGKQYCSMWVCGKPHFSVIVLVLVHIKVWLPK